DGIHCTLHSFPTRRSSDLAGTVEAIGSNVTQFRAGDDVYGTCDGAFAEYASARADTLAPRPSNLTFEQAAAVPHGAITALQGLRSEEHTSELQSPYDLVCR